MKVVSRGPVEIIVFALSLILVLTVIGVFIYDGLITPSVPPTILIDLREDQIRKVPEGFALPLALENIGNEAAENIRVEVRARSETGEVQTAEVVIPFLPEGSTRDAVVIFTEDPRQAAIEARTVSYTLP